MKFKVGDVIKYTNGNHSRNDRFISGEYYTVSGLDNDGDPIIDFDDGEEHAEYASYFTLISRNDLEYAMSLVGKTVKVIDSRYTFKVEAVGMRNKYTVSDYDTAVIQREVSKSGCAIILHNEFTVVCLKEVEEFTDTVELSNTHIARIEGEYVTVGCLKIPMNKIQEILDVYNQNK